MAASRQTISVGGRRLSVSSLDKVLYPATGTTKGDVFAYYAQIAEVMIPHCKDRPATRKRWPNGVGEDGEGQFFFQKNVGEGVPDWVDVRAIQHSDHVNEYPLVNDVATLTWLAQLASLEIHVPQWRFGEGDTKQNPDRLVLDLDPGEGVGLRDCAEVAKLAREILSDTGLESIPVTSGSKGIHLYASLDGTITSDQASQVAKELARALEADYPDDVTSSMKRAERPGKVFIDWSQNNASKTTIAPYSLRGRREPMVAAPRTWRELSSAQLKQLDYREVLRRVERRGDPMAELAPGHTESGARDPLTLYRAKRDANKTPEPVPEDAPEPRDDEHDAPVFVIQRHEARRLHYDFRLEHDGVLVSWALPKGVPTDPKRNHLAVPTEDHPMEYRHFSGTIPKGEYGAGQVEIWDSGTVEFEKWRDDEVIATLTGSENGGLGGSCRFALFRTHDDPEKPQWMIHLMKDQRGGRHTAPQAGSESRPTTKTRGKPRTAPKPDGESRTARPKRLRPMLATRGRQEELRDLEGEWAFEMKWDGMRALLTVSESGVHVESRAGHNVTSSYPDLEPVAHAVAPTTVTLDGEIVAFDRTGVPSFSQMQKRMNVTSTREVQAAMKDAPVSFMAFDVLEIDGTQCVSLPYSQRRELIEGLLLEEHDAPIDVPPAFPGDVEAALTASRDLRLEGIVAKRCASLYRPGVRSSEWLKFSHSNAAEVVVVGWRESEADPASIASLLVAVPDADGLTYAGRVGTGFNTVERRRILEKLSGKERKTPPVEVPPADRRDAHWVTPNAVGEVTFRERTEGGRFRQPVWRGWRPDKRVRDISPVEA